MLSWASFLVKQRVKDCHKGQTSEILYTYIIGVGMKIGKNGFQKAEYSSTWILTFRKSKNLKKLIRSGWCGSMVES